MESYGMDDLVFTAANTSKEGINAAINRYQHAQPAIDWFAPAPSLLLERKLVEQGCILSGVSQWGYKYALVWSNWDGSGRTLNWYGDDRTWLVCQAYYLWIMMEDCKAVKQWAPVTKESQMRPVFFDAAGDAHAFVEALLSDMLNQEIDARLKIPAWIKNDWLSERWLKRIKDNLAEMGYVVNVQTEWIADLGSCFYSAFVREIPTSTSDLIMYHGKTEEEVCARALLEVLVRKMDRVEEEEPERYWNPRVVCMLGLTEGASGQMVLFQQVGIHEVHYDHGFPSSVTQDPVPPQAESHDEFMNVWEMYCRAAAKPMLYFDLVANRFVAGPRVAGENA